MSYTFFCFCPRFGERLACPDGGLGCAQICSRTERPVSCSGSSDKAAVAPIVGDRPYHKPIEMFSVAPETPTQFDDLRRKCPNVEFTDQLVPIARNYQEKKAILAATNFDDLN